MTENFRLNQEFKNAIALLIKRTQQTKGGTLDLTNLDLLTTIDGITIMTKNFKLNQDIKNAIAVLIEQALQIEGHALDLTNLDLLTTIDGKSAHVKLDLSLSISSIMLNSKVTT